MWFSDEGTAGALGRVTPSGQITEFTGGLNAGSAPAGIAPGRDGAIWFGDDGTTIAMGRIDTGEPAASLSPPSVTGSAQEGTQQVCQGDRWSTWGGQQPLLDAFSFDGYTWLRDGVQIAGGRAYTPVAADIGHQLSCTATVTYPLLGEVTAAATSDPVTVLPQSSGPQGPPGANGADGAQGPPGPAGKIELVTCKTVTKRVHRRKVRRQQCTAKLVSGTLKFKTARATLSRAGRVYARGSASGGGRHGGLRVTLVRARRLPAGRYLLTLRRRGRRALRLTVAVR